MPISTAVTTLMDGLPLTAASFIVTIYGDVVVPRGGVLWMGSLIEICDEVGIRENLVRTAVSRLVSAGQLVGERVGRRSYYRLAPAAQKEFAQAAHLLYAREFEAAQWRVIYAPDITDSEARRHRMARMGGDVWLCPHRGETEIPSALTMHAQLPEDPSALSRFWDMGSIQSRYAAMLDRFAGLDTSDEGSALALRLLLVHVYRGALLRDPGLPEAALPADWQGATARRLFRDLYTALSPAADSRIALLEGAGDALARQTPETKARMTAIA